MKSVHIILQGKGGVGKSVVARLLAEYLTDKKKDYIGFDADPVNHTFASTNPNIEILPLLENGNINQGNFDAFIEKVLNNESNVIIDTGASSFLPFMEYIFSSQIIDIFQENNCEVFIHTIVTGGTSAKDTISGFINLSEKFGDSCNIVVWENEFFGPVTLEGVPFKETKSFKEVKEKGHLVGVVMIYDMHVLHKAAFKRFLDGNLTFDEAASPSNKGMEFMMKTRVKQIKNNLLPAIDAVIGE